MKCPMCERGNLKKRNIKEILFGVDLGKFPAYVCTQCEESFTDEKTTRTIEESAKKKNLFGLI